MRTVHVAASRDYDIHIGEGLIKDVGQLAHGVIAPCKVALISDAHVSPLYLGAVETSLSASGYEVYPMILEPGEPSKSMPALERILDFLCMCPLTKSDVVAALGGGVIGDAAGFAAAVYLRGISYIQIPTTLLAAVDSSVGGKTAVNLPAGKNLAGAFHQPSLVICDTQTLATLPRDVFSDGVAEAVKYGVIGSRSLFDKLQNGFSERDTEEIIAECVTMKADIVAQDEFDEGVRQLLNFGHTIGHAIEGLSGFSIRHGHAVAVGMAIMARAANRLGLSREDCAPEIEKALHANGLPDACEYSASELAQAAMADKKRRGGRITVIMPDAIGCCRRYGMPVEALEDMIWEGLGR